MSFRDTFTRNSSGNQNLQYDDVAFHHFFITIMIVIALPLFYSIIKTIISPFSKVPRLQQLQSKKQFRQKVMRFKKENRYAYINKMFVLKIILCVLLAYGITISFIAIKQNAQQLKGFDPYQILGVQQNAPVQKIKKAYRKLALQFHPDRNRDNPEASAKFIMISKAYQCLTDQEAKAKCQKYGNPQGSHSFNVGIALPSFLIKKQNHLTIMAVVFVLVVIILPIFLIQYHTEVNKYDDYGMLYENHSFIHGFLNQHYSVRDCVKTLAICCQFKNLKTNKEQIPKLQLMLKNASQQIEKVLKKKNYLGYIKKSMLIMDARLSQQQIPKQLQEDCKFIMKKLPLLVKATVMVGFTRSIEYVSKSQKFVGFNALQSLIWFGQYFIQGKSFQHSQSFQQLSLTSQEIERVFKKKKNKKITSITQLINKQDQRQYFLSLLDPNRAVYIKQCLQYYPKVTVETFVRTQGDSDLTALDVFQIIIDVKANRKSSFCSSPTYPFLKVEGWYVIAVSNNSILFMEHFTFEELQHQFKFGYRQDKAGSYSLTIKVLPDCYFGMDIESVVKYEVGQHRKFTQQQQKNHLEHDHQHDEPSFFSKMMESIVPKQEEELSDKQDQEDQDKKSLTKEGETQKPKQKK